MIGALTKEEMINLLEICAYGHIGYFDGKDATVLPINFAFANGVLYVHTYEGEKLRAIREHPRVCIQVERVNGPTSWKSVVVWGTAQELKENDEEDAARTLLQHYTALEAQHGQKAHIRWGQDPSQKHIAVYLKIAIDRWSGRFEER